MKSKFEEIWSESPFKVYINPPKEPYDYKKYIENYISTMKKLKGINWSQ